MIKITFKDGNVKEFPKGVTPGEIAASISSSLQKAAFVAKFNNELVDLSRSLSCDGALEILTRDSPEALEIIRHDTAHLLAEAAKELYGKDLQVTIGPAIENGFYYDFARDKPFTPEDLLTLENKMKEIVDRDEPIVREEWDRDEAISFFTKIGETYKAEIIGDIPAGETISLYRQGIFIDLCRGPHASSTRKIGKAFKLMKLAGAYWRGDSKNAMLQRIYGTAWVTEKDLQDYLTRLEEAEKRDHRKLGRQLELFHLQEEAVGSVFWHPKGWILYSLLKEYIRKKIAKADYKEVNTPLMVDKSLWEKSGHWEKFGEHMFVVKDEDDHTLAVKPMNCPCHIEIFKQGTKSYRDLPLRLAEFGHCHRNEPSGALHGIMRVRSFVQDDAHIFCTEDQILSEAEGFCRLLSEIYKELGFDHFFVKFSDRPEKRAGDDLTWDRAEEKLRSVLENLHIEYSANPGEGSFYGPKLEFVLKDALGRDWQCGTLQLDFILPERLGATYMGEDGQTHRPVMLHRAILGTFERFIGILIEHYAGKFPVWLAPVQVVVASITTGVNDYAQEVYDQLKKEGIRVEIDLRNEKISYKIREHSVQKVPYVLVVGQKEADNRAVAVRTFGGDAQEIVSLQEITERLKTISAIPS
ncbi:MAG: threonine--tRNA ligase [Alphaproteobacteria bacterium]